MEKYLKPVTKSCAKKISNQMENYLYIINKKEGNHEIGYFIQLKDKNNKSHLALVTNSNILEDINNNSLNIIIDNEPKLIELGNIRYENKIYNKAVIEIKNNNDIKYFFEIDDNIYNSELEVSKNYYNESIYIIQYDTKDNISLLYGIINVIYKNKIKYSGNITSDIKDNIILNLNNNKIIGIDINKSKKGKNGMLIHDLIHKFIYEINYKLTLYDRYKKNFIGINIIINIDKNDKNKNIFFLDNCNNKENKIYNHSHLKELNEDNTKLFINGKLQKYKNYFQPEKEGEYMIGLVIELGQNKYLTDFSYMFYGCENIKYIHFSNFFTTNVKDISYMFYNCKSLKSLPDISKWNTDNVNNMSYMFYNCKSLKSLPDISKWNTSKVTNMIGMFSRCYSLKSLPDISKWNTKNVNDMSYIFYGCELLNSLPDISKWNTINVINFSYIFYNCKSLQSLPDISKWNTVNAKDMSGMFGESNSLQSLPDISKWNTNKVTKMTHIFYNCISLQSLPDISKWNTNNLNDMSYMFSGCTSLKSLRDISNWIGI